MFTDWFSHLQNITNIHTNILRIDHIEHIFIMNNSKVQYCRRKRMVTKKKIEKVDGYIPKQMLKDLVDFTTSRKIELG